MRGGERLEIKQGTYEENISNPPSGTSSNRTVIATYGTDTVIFTKNTVINFYSGGFSYVDFTGKFIWSGPGQGGDPWVCCEAITFGDNTPATHIRFDGIRVTNWPGNGTQLGLAADDIQFKNCRYDNNGQTLDANNQVGYHFYIKGSNILIEHCELDHSGGYAIHQYYPGDAGGNNIYRNNIIHNNGITVSGNQADGILLYSNSSNHRVYNNIIFNHARGSGIRVVMCTNCKVFNNTVYNNATGVDVWSSASGTLIKNNIVYGNTRAINNNGIATSLSNNLTIDPEFVSPSNYDFRLQSTSPAIDAGVSLTEVATDIRGTSRPQNASYDIGAFEVLR
jgi:parallel beta-helix repeat protein